MKVAIITDTHYGVRNDSISILDFSNEFLTTTFFTELEKRGIDTVFHLGDLFDRRKYVNIYTAYRARNDFLDKLAKYNVHIIAGNHDVFYKSTNEVNILKEIANLSAFNVYTSPAEIEVDGKKILLLPWIAPDIEEETLEAIKNTDASICFGHLELKGFEMHKGSFSESGQEPSTFAKFDIVCSGHFHHKSTYQNINYLGSPWEMTWADFNDCKGFHIFDTDTLELEFIANPHKLFHKVVYDDEGKQLTDVMNIDFKRFKSCYVKVVVKSKTNPFLYDQFIQKLEDAGVSHLQAVDDHLNISLDIDDEIINEAESTIDILQKSIRTIGIKQELEKPLEQLLRTLYNEASLIQS